MPCLPDPPSPLPEGRARPQACAPCAALYIYYRVPRAQRVALCAAFARLLAAQPAWPGPAPQLMRRSPDAAHPHDTWMEVWPDPLRHVDGLAEAIRQIEHRAADSGLTALTDARHHEYFEAVSP